ncbi:2-C-methyl-D-erythritol 4-phosphate cytidylyltransferase [candidate division KSB1 bacterium]
MKIGLILAAGGIGKRFGSGTRKQYLTLCDKPVLYWTLMPFLETNKFENIVISVPEEDINYVKTIVPDSDIIEIIAGGKERYHSVYNALTAIPEDTDFVLIHDAVRPFIKKSKILEIIRALSMYEALTVGYPVSDTIVTGSDNEIIEYQVRSTLWLTQTPQAFKYSLILKAYKNAFENGDFSTDDTYLVKNIGVNIKIIPGDKTNIKITTPEDYELAEIYIKNFKY